MTSARFDAVVDRVMPAQLACRIGARARAGERDAWPAVVSIALGTFALVFSELIPVGLLADISGHLGVSVGTGGLLIAASALLLAIVTGARPLIIALVAVWGLGYGAVPVAAQSWMARAMPANVEGGLALFVSALQGSLATGSAVGGIVYDAKGPGGALVLAAVVAAAGSLTLLGPGPRGHQLPAGRADRSGRRTGPGRAGPAARRNRSSSKQCMTTTLTSPFAAIRRPRPERKELP